MGAANHPAGNESDNEAGLLEATSAARGNDPRDRSAA